MNTNGFKVGDRVRVPMGNRKVDAMIIEDRGRIGAGGRQLFAVEVPMDPLDPLTFEVPAVEIEPAAGGGEQLEKRKVIDYLKGGGLVNILRSNMSGGRNPPHVWLRHDTRGNITHTFVESRGALGGAPVPFGVTHGKSIFLPKVSEVIDYLRTFGLRRDEAEAVINAVGKNPA